MIDGIFVHAGKGINAAMLNRVTAETIQPQHSLRASLNNDPHEGNIKGIENHMVSIARTLEQLVKGKN